MSEIPMPTSDPYQPERKSSTSGTCLKIFCGICVCLIIVYVIVILIILGGLAAILGGI